MSEELVNMTYRLSDGTETTYLVELQPESDYSLMDKKFYEAGVQAERERIIKLLESDPEELIDAGGGLRAGYETAITLIKGEQE